MWFRWETCGTTKLARPVGAGLKRKSLEFGFTIAWTDANTPLSKEFPNDAMACNSPYAVAVSFLSDQPVAAYVAADRDWFWRNERG